MVLLLVAGVTLGYQTRMAYELRLGEEGDDSYIEGFYDPESNPYDVYRWSGQKGLIRFPGIGIPRAVTLRLRMNGARPEGVPLPRIVLKVNGQKLSELTAEGQMKIYEFDVPAKMVGWSGDMELQIDSETFSPAGGDLRELGLMVDWVMVVPQHQGIVVPAPLPLASVVFAVTIGCLPLKGKRLPKEVVVLGAIGLPIVAGLLFAFHRIQAARWAWQLLLVVGAGYLGFITWDGFLALRGSLREIRRLTIAILLLALVIQLALLAPRFDEGPNIWTYKNWMWYTNTVSLEKLYLEPWALPQPVYPPVSLYIFHIIGWIYQCMVSPIPPPSVEPTPLLSFLMRLPGVICNVLLALTVFLYIQRWKGPRWAHLAMVLFAFNPAVILHTTRWGQIDSVHSLLVVASVICATAAKPELSWMLISLATAAKPQALVFLPVILLLTWKESGRRGLLRGMLAAASTTVIVMSPFICSGTWNEAMGYFASLPQHSVFATDTTHNAHNLWWLIGLGKSVPASNPAWSLSLPIVGPLSYEVVGFLLFAIAVLFALWRLARTPKGGWMWAIVAYIAFSFFMLPTKVHENYMYTVFPMLAMAIYLGKPLTAIYLGLSGTWLFNLLLQDPAVLGLLGAHSPGNPASAATDIARALNALLNAVVLVLWTVVLTRVKGRESVEDAELA
jgi:Gpi18-like mannosyltransferase